MGNPASKYPQISAEQPNAGSSQLKEENKALKLELESLKLKSVSMKTRHFELDIIHFNDVYNLRSQFKEEPVGGVTKFATVLFNLKAELQKLGREPLIVFSGDFVGPSLLSTITQGAHLIEAFNELGVQYGTFGNHEFDYGYASLIDKLSEGDLAHEYSCEGMEYPGSNTKWIMTNMTEGATGLPCGGKFAERYALVDWGQPLNQIKIGILGVSENWLDACSKLKPHEIVYEDFIESSRKTARLLKQKGADIVLALTHNRYENDITLTDSVPEIDLLLGGHDHFYKRNRAKRIVKGGEEWRWLNHIIVEFDFESSNNGKESGRISALHTERYDVESDNSDHPALQILTDKYEAICAAKYSKVLFRSPIVLDPTEESVRFQEGILSNFLCDIVCYDNSELEGIQSSDMALLMGFTFSGKTKLPVGDFTLGNLMSVFPVSLQIIVVELVGSDIMKSLQLGVRHLPRESGSIHHCSNRLKYTVNISTDPTVFPTVTNVLFDNTPMDMNRTFSVAITATMGKGKYGFSWFGTAKRIINEENGSQIQDLVKQYCTSHYVDGSPTAKTFDPPALGRITINRP